MGTGSPRGSENDLEIRQGGWEYHSVGELHATELSTLKWLISEATSDFLSIVRLYASTAGAQAGLILIRNWN